MVLNGTHKMQINVKHIAKQSNFLAFLCKQSFRFLYHYAAALLENCDGKIVPVRDYVSYIQLVECHEIMLTMESLGIRCILWQTETLYMKTLHKTP